MLKVINYNEEEYCFPCLLVLGCFDALHIGHAELLKKAKLQAKINGLDLGVMMFADGKGGKQVFSFEERLNFLEQYNVKFVLKVDFNDAFKKIKPLDFLNCLEEKLNVKAYMSGKDFRFGDGAKGKSSTLKNYAEDEENGVWYMPVKELVFEGDKVSTTSIKSLLECGAVGKAGLLLGREFFVSGKVIHGADRGGKILNYPTLNIIYPDNKVEIKLGVYKVKCVINGKEYYGIANYGPRPTFGEEDKVLEVHLNGLTESLYDETVTVEFINYIRETKKFETVEELSAQLARDILFVDSEAELAATNVVEDNAEEQTVENTEVIKEAQTEDEDFESELDEAHGESVEQTENDEVVTEETAAIVEESIVEETDFVEGSESDAAESEETAESAEETLDEEAVTENDEVVTEETVEIVEESIVEETDVVEDNEPDTAESEEIAESAEETLDEEAVTGNDEVVTEETVEIVEESIVEETDVVEDSEPDTKESEETAESAETTEDVAELADQAEFTGPDDTDEIFAEANNDIKTEE